LREAKSLREQVLHSSLLVAVVVGGVAFARTLLDAINLEAWRIAGGTVALYGGFVILLFAKRLPYRVRALGFLGLLYVVGVWSLLMAGYLAAPVLILACQSVLASVLFQRWVTLIVLCLNLVTLLAVGAVLSAGLMVVETTTFYDPAGFMNWIRVATIFAVFCGIAVVSVDVVTNHLNQSLRDQAELIENLKGAMQLRDAAESQRRAAESRLREAHHKDEG
jgi:pimeloyl-ACP methyl ester carboxylesterase